MQLFLIRTCFSGEELYRNAIRASRKKNHNVVSSSIAVLKLFRDIGWDKLEASSGGNYWKLTAFGSI